MSNAPTESGPDAEVLFWCDRFLSAHRVWSEISRINWLDEEITDKSGEPFYLECLTAYRKAFSIPARTQAGVIAKLRAFCEWQSDETKPIDFDARCPAENMVASLTSDMAALQEVE